ncbi:MAG: hemerythrin domain-containing protein [Sphingobacteriaceae bacterium]|nr:hemerythrin domain-containing protein [Sphingobacteriaceae bacterium]
MIDLKETNKKDPIKRNVENGLDNMKGCTPFDPPSVYEEENKPKIDFDAMPEALQELMKEHKVAVEKIEAFENALVEYKTSGYVLNPSINSTLSEFFKFYDNNLLVHNEKEDKALFPILNAKLLESGEHSIGENPKTAIDVMEDDHVKFIQLGTLCFNLFGLATRIKDPQSRMFICDTAYDTSREFTELLRLHIYREDYTLFPLAHKLISAEEFEEISKKQKRYK